MKPIEFNELLNERLKKITETLEQKALQYESSSDRLHNFKVAAQLSNSSAEEALWGMAMKHLVSVTDLVSGQLENTRGNVDEKIGDMINYLILLEAVLEDVR